MQLYQPYTQPPSVVAQPYPPQQWQYQVWDGTQYVMDWDAYNAAVDLYWQEYWAYQDYLAEVARIEELNRQVEEHNREEDRKAEEWRLLQVEIKLKNTAAEFVATDKPTLQRHGFDNNFTRKHPGKESKESSMYRAALAFINKTYGAYDEFMQTYYAYLSSHYMVAIRS